MIIRDALDAWAMAQPDYPYERDTGVIFWRPPYLETSGTHEGSRILIRRHRLNLDENILRFTLAIPNGINWSRMREILMCDMVTFIVDQPQITMHEPDRIYRLDAALTGSEQSNSIVDGTQMSVSYRLSEIPINAVPVNQHREIQW